MIIALLGDIAFTGRISEEPENNVKRYKTIIPFLKTADLVFANFEAPVKVDKTQNEEKKLIHYASPEPTKELLKTLNISCVSLANNHIYDCKMPGLKATINILDELGIHHTGAGWLPEHTKPTIINKNGYKIAFIAYVDKSTNPKTEKFPELLINYFEANIVNQEIKSLKPKVDKIICSIHWGNDYSFYPTKEQVLIARQLIDFGADIIMGHHTHTFQPFEKHNGGRIFYSLGGFTFGDYKKPGSNKYQSLYRNTKKSALVLGEFNHQNWKFIPIKELKGNYITISKRNYYKWNRQKWMEYRLINNSKLVKKIFVFKEEVLNRVYEYFFGYYQNPIKRLFQIANLRKVKKLFLKYSERH